MSIDQSSDPSRRQQSRVSLAAEVQLRRAGVHSFQVRVFDLSPTGCKVEFVERPIVNEHLWVKLGRLEALGATVRWVTGMVGGLEFDRAIHAAVFANLLQQLE